jgi:AraC-like DNA-binding protein
MLKWFVFDQSGGSAARLRKRVVEVTTSTQGLPRRAGAHPGNTPLHYQFHCRHPREAEDVIGRVFEPRFELSVADASQFHFSLDHHPCGAGVSISRLAFQSEVTVHIEKVEEFMVQMPLAGRNDVVLDGSSRLSLSNQTFSVINPGRSVWQRRSRNCEMVLVRFAESHIAQCLDTQLGDLGVAARPSKPLEFAPQMSMREAGGAALSRLISFLIGELSRNDTVLCSPLASSQAGYLLMSTLLMNQRHNYADLLYRPTKDMPPRFLRDAKEWLHGNAHRAITIDDLARTLNVGTRSVYAAFRRYLNQSPMDYLKDVRLGKVREQLLAADTQTQVTSVAMDWGFTHLGNFSHDYRMKFGELPSQTLRTARRRL